MQVKVTAAEINNAGMWTEFCEMSGVDYYAMNMGKVQSDTEFILTGSQAARLGFAPKSFVEEPKLTHPNAAMTANDFLEMLLMYKNAYPELMDKPIVASFGNDENGNADVMMLETLTVSTDLECNGVQERIQDALVILLEEDKESNDPS